MDTTKNESSSASTKPTQRSYTPPSHLVPGNYRNGYGKVVTVVKDTLEEGYLFATNGYWYQTDGKKALPKLVGKERSPRKPDSHMLQDLDLATFRPLTDRQISELYVNTSKTANETVKKGSVNTDKTNTRNQSKPHYRKKAKY